MEAKAEEILQVMEWIWPGEELESQREESEGLAR